MVGDERPAAQPEVARSVTAATPLGRCRRARCRQVRDRRRAGPGRLRHHLSRPRYAARPRRRHQGIPADRLRAAPGRHHRRAALDPDGRGFPLGPRPLPRRGQDLGAARGRARHRQRLRLHGGQRHGLHGHGAGPRRDAGGPPQARPPPAATGDRAAALSPARRSGGRARGRLPAPRHQARQHPDRRRRPADPDRFRRLARGVAGPHPGDDGGLYAGLRRARADDAVGQAGTVDRHLCAGRHALSLRHRPDAAQRHASALTGDALLPAAEAGKGRYGPSLLAAIDLGAAAEGGATDRRTSRDWRRALVRHRRRAAPARRRAR